MRISISDLGRYCLIGFITLTLNFSCNCNKNAKKEAIKQDELIGPAKINYMTLLEGQFGYYSKKVTATNYKGLIESFDYFISNKNDSGVVIYFHGGLVNPVTAYTQPISDGFDKAYRKGNCIPFSILYGGGLGETFWSLPEALLSSENDNSLSWGDSFIDDNADSMDLILSEIYNSASFNYLAIQLAKYLKIKLPSETTNLISSQIENEYHSITNLDIDNLHRKLSATIENHDSILYKQLMSSLIDTAKIFDSLAISMDSLLFNDEYFKELVMYDIHTLVNNDGQSELLYTSPRDFYDIGMIVYNVLRRYYLGRDHGLLCTLIEEIAMNSRYFKIVNGLGYRGWSAIKNLTYLPFTCNGSGCDKAGYDLLDQLVRYNSISGNKTITLLGSSTGSVFICNLLLAASMDDKYKDLNFNVIFCVPACTFELMAKTINKAGKHIKDIYIFTLSEYDDLRAGVVYEGSILYFVSAICEKDTYHDKPILGMERFYKKDFLLSKRIKPRFKTDVETVIGFIQTKVPKGAPITERIIFSSKSCTHPTLCNLGKKHGDVIRNEYVLTSISQLLLQFNLEL